MMVFCTVRKGLQDHAVAVLQELINATKAQRAAIIAADYATVKPLDPQIENLFGSKERAFGALWEHIREHGC
jgi:hypothetical protein